MKQKLLQAMFAVLLIANANAQVNSGSNGSDGAFNPTTNTVINMADHPDGIYQYTSVNISNGVTVTFIPNANNTPVVWLVQGDALISGSIVLSGQLGVLTPGNGGPGASRGGNPGGSSAPAGDGQGPGGGDRGDENLPGGNASFATAGDVGFGQGNSQGAAGQLYGNQFLLPLIGGSGGGGIQWYKGSAGGGGGGGAILIAASGSIQVDGAVIAAGGDGGLGTSWNDTPGAGGGSGGAIRLIGTQLKGIGSITASGGRTPWYRYSWCMCTWYDNAGMGRVWLDAMANTFTGPVSGCVTRGFQPIIIPPANQAVSLAIQSVGGVAVVANPTGVPTTPDVIVPGAQPDPVFIVVRCVNIPLNTDIIVDVKPANGPTVRAVGSNNTGTQASSTATVSVTMPRGAGTIQAKAVSGIAGSLGASLNNGERFRNYAQTGLTADGEFFAKMEITAALGKGQEIAYITESGKRFVLPRN